MALVYLTFFNGRRTWREALSLDATGVSLGTSVGLKKTTDLSAQIIKLFQSFADDQNNIYEVHDGAHAYIEKAVEKIRTVHERWLHPVHTTTTLSWYLVRVSYLGNPHQNPGYIVGNPNFIEVGYLGNIFKLRTLYDIVGWIFSVVGNVPVRATRENYYYPLMMIAYVFCSKLAPALPRHSLPISRAPDVWVVWWFQQTVENRPVTRVVLGATLDKPGKDVTGKNVKDETKDLRKYWLKEAGLLKDGTTVPMQMMKSWGMSGQDFGHCAETYPLLFICS